MTDLNELTGAVVDSGIKIHSALGPGLLESAYEACLAYELRKRHLSERSKGRSFDQFPCCPSERRHQKNGEQLLKAVLCALCVLRGDCLQFFPLRRFTSSLDQSLQPTGETTHRR
ncbi:MAG: GxxExxY protein [Gemmatimonadaceae bacterium]